jgi:hypothetical protein
VIPASASVVLVSQAQPLGVRHPFGGDQYGYLRTRSRSLQLIMTGVQQTAAPALQPDRVVSWEEEMGRAVDQRDALPAAAREAVCRVLESLLEEESAATRGTDEVLAAIVLLRSRC